MLKTSPQKRAHQLSSFRMALGALIIKKKLGISVSPRGEQIRENPYLQYFIGQLSYSNEVPFDRSLLVHFRPKISGSSLNISIALVIGLQSIIQQALHSPRYPDYPDDPFWNWKSYPERQHY